MQVGSAYKGDSGSAGVYISIIYIYLGRTLPYPVHRTTPYISGLVLLVTISSITLYTISYIKPQVT